ncbi:hypothetical protein KAJ27_24530 [bacterium]|nr:hypothetical protein [bacterium]
MKRILLLLLLMALICSNTAYAYGPRAVGMGMAYYALSDDANAIFFNPAGLTQLTKDEKFAEVMLKVNDRDLESLDTIAVTGQVFREEEKVKFSISEYLRQDFRPELHEKKLYFNYALGALFYRVSTIDDYYKMSNGYLTIARPILDEPRLSAGVTLISSSHDTHDQHGSMITMTIGLMYEFNKMINIGLVFEDIVKNGPYKSPIIANIGVLIKLTESTKITVDGYNLTSEDYSWRWRSNRGAEFRLGFEKSFINDTLAIRFGTKNGNLDMGLGVQITPTFRIDYAMNYDNKADILYNPLEYQHFIAAKVKF